MRMLLMVFVLSAVSGLVACQATTGKSASQNMSDASITASVQGKLTADKISNFTRVDVDTERGTVLLSGVVQTSDQKARAEELAKQVNGVRRVQNNLQTQTAQP
jgi:hyperosmotically inducible protein